MPKRNPVTISALPHRWRSPQRRPIATTRSSSRNASSEALLVAAERGLEQQDSRLLERVAGAALEQALGADEVPSPPNGNRRGYARRWRASPRRGRKDRSTRAAAVDRVREVRGDRGAQLDELERAAGILEAPLARRFQQQVAESPGVETRAVGHHHPLAIEWLACQLVQQGGRRALLGGERRIGACDLTPGRREGRRIVEELERLRDRRNLQRQVAEVVLGLHAQRVDREQPGGEAKAAQAADEEMADDGAVLDGRELSAAETAPTPRGRGASQPSCGSLARSNPTASSWRVRAARHRLVTLRMLEVAISHLLGDLGRPVAEAVAQPEQRAAADRQPAEHAVEVAGELGLLLVRRLRHRDAGRGWRCPPPRRGCRAACAST